MACPKTKVVHSVSLSHLTYKLRPRGTKRSPSVFLW